MKNPRLEKEVIAEKLRLAWAVGELVEQIKDLPEDLRLETIRRLMEGEKITDVLNALYTAFSCEQMTMRPGGGYMSVTFRAKIGKTEKDET